MRGRQSRVNAHLRGKPQPACNPSRQLRLLRFRLRSEPAVKHLTDTPKAATVAAHLGEPHDGLIGRTAGSPQSRRSDPTPRVLAPSPPQGGAGVMSGPDTGVARPGLLGTERLPGSYVGAPGSPPFREESVGGGLPP